jgi:hypothetical protein
VTAGRRAGGLPRELVRELRRLDEPQLRRAAILVRGLLISSDGPATDPTDVPGFPEVRYRRQHVRCGRDCAACPHGPYWYAYWREPDGRPRSQYIANQLPAELRALLEASVSGIEGRQD